MRDLLEGIGSLLESGAVVKLGDVAPFEDCHRQHLLLETKESFEAFDKSGAFMMPLGRLLVCIERSQGKFSDAVSGVAGIRVVGDCACWLWHLGHAVAQLML